MRDFTLSNKMARVAGNLLDCALDIENSLYDADYCVKAIANAELYGKVSVDIPELAVEAGTATENARKELAAFDKELANLIALRGAISEVTGIPMFSYIPLPKRFPKREVYDM